MQARASSYYRVRAWGWGRHATDFCTLDIYTICTCVCAVQCRNTFRAWRICMQRARWRLRWLEILKNQLICSSMGGCAQTCPNFVPPRCVILIADFVRRATASPSNSTHVYMCAQATVKQCDFHSLGTFVHVCINARARHHTFSRANYIYWFRYFPPVRFFVYAYIKHWWRWKHVYIAYRRRSISYRLAKYSIFCL